MLYDVTFKTGDLPDSGTDANVFFQIVGENESTEEILLQEDKSLKLFETGGTDKFKVETKDVGKVRQSLLITRAFCGRPESKNARCNFYFSNIVRPGYWCCRCPYRRLTPKKQELINLVYF